MTNVIFGQVADEDELRSGVRREGAFFGVNALITKPAQSLALTLIPVILTATGFITRDANGGKIFLNQSESAIFGIKVLIGLIPGIALLIGAALLQWYPLKGKKLDQMKTDLIGLHEKKHNMLDQ